MMDLVSIASFISLEVASGFLKEHGKEIYHKVKGLLTPDELISLNLLEKYPESKELQAELATALETRLVANPGFVQELEALIAKLPASETKNNVVNQTGAGNTAIQDVHGSKININK